jgi:hypothetical protein
LPIGEQKGIDPKRLKRWWNKLGNFLHVQMPRDRTQVVSSYPNPDWLREKLLEMIEELQPLSRGTADFFLYNTCDDI